MPELKHTFTGGKMDKDSDERIIANGQYREALNIEVATSENSDVGAAQNILGNLKQTLAISGYNNKYLDYNHHIAHIINPLTDNVYRFIHTPAEPVGVWMDRIVEFNTQGMGSSGGRIFSPYYNEKAVAVDIYKVRTICTGATTTTCDQEVFLQFTTNVSQMRWGMQLTEIIGEFETKPWGVYIQSIDIIDDGTGSTPRAISCKMNVSANDFEIDPATGQRIPLRVDISTLIGKQFIFEADRNLNFSTERNITGLNIIDDMLFWTDDYSEPKKINIERAKKGSTFQSWDTWRDRRLLDGITGFDFGDFDQQTRLVVKEVNPTDCVINNNICGTTPVNGGGGVGGKLGCTDPLADNYDSGATTDDGSCTYDGEPPVDPCEGLDELPFTIELCITDMMSLPPNSLGSASVIVTGGSGLFTYTWTNGSSGTTNTGISGLTEGAIGVTVEDTCTGQTATDSGFVNINNCDDQGVPGCNESQACQPCPPNCNSILTSTIF